MYTVEVLRNNYECYVINEIGPPSFGIVCVFAVPLPAFIAGCFLISDVDKRIGHDYIGIVGRIKATSEGGTEAAVTSGGGIDASRERERGLTNNRGSNGSRSKAACPFQNVQQQLERLVLPF